MSNVVSPYPVIYSFGDSLSDAGDAYLLTSSPAGATLGLTPQPVSPPYYQETYGTTAADVFSNGPVWVQDLASALNLANPAPGELGLSPALLGSLLTSQGVSGALASLIVGGIEVATGTSSGTLNLAGTPGGTDFAIGGSVTGVTAENTGPGVALTDLSAQLAYFKAAFPAPTANALYTVWSGSNDLLNLVNDKNFGSLNAAGTVAADVTASVANEVAAVNSLLTGGASSLLVLNVPDIGLTPEESVTSNAAEASALAQSFDQQLAAELQGDTLATGHVTLVDTYGLIDNAVHNMAQYGLTNVTDPAYTGSFTADTGTLVAPGLQSGYLFFDHLHPTETGQMATAKLAQSDLGIACYCAGTRILTDRGEVAVEALAIGDRLVTQSGAARPVRWIGHRSYAGRFLAGRKHLLPIRIGAGALGEGLPRRDLLVSPLHAMALRGVLAPAALLANGVTIVQVRDAERVDYYHVELDSHDVIMAEGAWSETFVDDGSRGVFHNAHEYPDTGRVPAAYCAPRIVDGEALEAIRREIDARAGLCVTGPVETPRRLLAG